MLNMADKQSDIKKSRKKRKSRSSKRKAEKDNLLKLLSRTDVKDSSVQKISNHDHYGSNNFTSKSGPNELKESSSTTDATHLHVNKYHNYKSQNFIDEVSPRSFRNRIGYPTNLGNYDSEVLTNRFTNQPFYASNNFQYSPTEIDNLNEEINFLRQENMRLTNALKIPQHTWEVQSNSEVDIIFKKRSLAEKFSTAVNKLISSLLSGKITAEELNKFCDQPRKSPEPLDDCLFAVDSSADLSLNSSVPMYDTSFEQILEKTDDSKNASPQKTPGLGRNRSCFNCDGDHNLNKCPYKFNPRKIAYARRQLKSNFVPSVRYHLHGKNENDFKPGIISDELREALGLEKNQVPLYVYRMRLLEYPPGWLYEAAVESSGMVLYDSEGNALKEENCEDGEVDTSAVRVQYDPDKLIDYPGFNVPLPPNMIEESETLGLPPLQPHQLRTTLEKFMTKPDVRPNRKRKINLPNERPSKVQRLEEDMEIEADSGNEGRIESTNDFNPPLPESAPPAPPPPPPPPPVGDCSETSEDRIVSKILEEHNVSLSDPAPNFSRVISCSEFSSGTSSPSLAELEELKKKLVMQLGNSVDDDSYYEPSDNPPLDDDSNSNVVIDDDKMSDSIYVLDECVASDLSNLSSASNSNSSPNKFDLSESSLNRTDLCENSMNKLGVLENSRDSSQTISDLHESSHSLERSLNQSKCIALGTPSLSCHSPYAKLPDYEKFSKDVSAHMPFENLPNSTGTYEKMKNVLKKVKDKLNSLMN